jgi:carbonic anhydrase
MISALDALQRLQEGNRRYVSGAWSHDPLRSQARRIELLEGQQPFAVILGCSDSRVPVEMIFDQGLGDLFVVRVAGNIASSSQIGSIEFAAEQICARLVVVLGHTRCGAIQVTLEEVLRPTEMRSPNLRAIVDRLRPSVEDLLAADPGHDRETLARDAMRANVRFSIGALRNESEILEELIDESDLLIVGADYCLETGAVDFFEGVPASSP